MPLVERSPTHSCTTRRTNMTGATALRLPITVSSAARNDGTL
jgi:hypothetical protein